MCELQGNGVSCMAVLTSVVGFLRFPECDHQEYRVYYMYILMCVFMCLVRLVVDFSFSGLGRGNAWVVNMFRSPHHSHCI